MDTPTWLHNELAKGIAALLCLRLDNAPADDMVAGTIAAWGVAISTGKAWDEALDRDRFAPGFRKLIASGLTRWPQPVKLLELLPPREQLALTKQTIPAAPERAQAAMAEIATLLQTPLADRPVTGKDAAAEQGQAA